MHAVTAAPTDPVNRPRPASKARPRHVAVTERKTGRPSRDAAAELTERIVAIATDLFVTQGYAATSVDHIVRLAGISKKTFYARFADKAEVFDVVVTGYVDRNLRPDGPPLLSQGLEAQLRELGGRLLAWTLQPDVLGLYRVAVAESQRFPELARKVFESPVSAAAQQVASLLQAWLPGLDPHEAMKLAHHYMNCTMSPPFLRAMQGLEPPGLNDERREQLREATAWFLHGIAPATGTPGADQPPADQAPS